MYVILIMHSKNCNTNLSVNSQTKCETQINTYNSQSLWINSQFIFILTVKASTVRSFALTRRCTGMTAKILSGIVKERKTTRTSQCECEVNELVLSSIYKTSDCFLIDVNVFTKTLTQTQTNIQYISFYFVQLSNASLDASNGHTTYQNRLWIYRLETYHLWFKSNFVSICILATEQFSTVKYIEHSLSKIVY